MRPDAAGAGPARRRNGGRRGRARGLGGLYRPGLIVISAVMFWAALNEPAMFNAASVTVWLLRAVTVGLLARAALALVEPATRLGAVLLSQAARPGEDEAGEP